MPTAVNPVKRVRPHGGSTWTNIPSPSSFVWKLEDVSNSSAGRNENGKMMKNMIGQTVGLELAWNNIKTATLHTILNAFNHEYVDVEYLDPLSGTASNNYFVTLEMYVGNRSAPMYNATLGLWQNITFSLIDRNGVTK